MGHPGQCCGRSLGRSTARTNRSNLIICIAKESRYLIEFNDSHFKLLLFYRFPDQSQSITRIYSSMIDLLIMILWHAELVGSPCFMHHPAATVETSWISGAILHRTSPKRASNLAPNKSKLGFRMVNTSCWNCNENIFSTNYDAKTMMV